MARLSFHCQCDKNLCVIARLLISPSLEMRTREINKILSEFSLLPNHPDLLYLPDDSKLGITEARKIKNHFSFKSFSGSIKAVVLEDASALTVEAQNALLKTLEELPEDALFILGADSEVTLLPTVVSRCLIVILTERSEYNSYNNYNNYNDYIKKLINLDIEERFEYIEKLKDREEFLHALTNFFHQQLSTHKRSDLVMLNQFLQELLQAERWAKQNVSIRAILEYLMLSMPQKL